MQQEKKILTLCSLSHFLTHFFILIFPALLIPMISTLKISGSSVVKISFLMYLLYGALAIPWGYLSDRFNEKNIMALGTILGGIGFILAYFSTSVTGLQLALSITGVGCSAYHPSGLSLISKGCANRGMALGINGMFGNLGISAAPAAAGILNYFVGWQTTLLILGILGVLSGIAILAVEIDLSHIKETVSKNTITKDGMVKLFILFCFAMLASGLMYRGYTTLLPAYFELELVALITTIKISFKEIIKYTEGIGTLIATLSTSFVYIVGMVGQYIGGKVADRFDLRWSYAIFFLFAFPFLVLMSLLSGSVVLLMAGLFVLFALGMQPIENSLVAIVTPEKWRSVSYGVKFTIVFGGGSFAVGIISILLQSYSIKQTMVFLTFPLAAVIICAFLVIFATKGHSIHQRKV